MDANARLHQAVVVGNYIGANTLERMVWPDHFAELNRIEDFWDYLSKQVAALTPPPKSIDELEGGLLRDWSSLPISVLDNLTDSVKSQYLHAKDRLIPITKFYNVSILLHNTAMYCFIQEWTFPPRVLFVKIIFAFNLCNFLCHIQ